MCCWFFKIIQIFVFESFSYLSVLKREGKIKFKESVFYLDGGLVGDVT